jgi:hypothetical protein
MNKENLEVVGVVGVDVSKPWIGGIVSGKPIGWQQAPEKKPAVLFKDLPAGTQLYAVCEIKQHFGVDE